jgi:hypothetical protein
MAAYACRANDPKRKKKKKKKKEKIKKTNTLNFQIPWSLLQHTSELASTNATGK